MNISAPLGSSLRRSRERGKQSALLDRRFVAAKLGRPGEGRYRCLRCEVARSDNVRMLNVAQSAGAVAALRNNSTALQAALAKEGVRP